MNPYLAFCPRRGLRAWYFGPIPEFFLSNVLHEERNGYFKNCSLKNVLWVTQNGSSLWNNFNLLNMKKGSFELKSWEPLLYRWPSLNIFSILEFINRI